MNILSLSVTTNYILFAIIAIIVNLGSQEIFLIMYPNLYISILVGTLLGFVTKYFLDKHLIFSSIGGSSIKEIGRYGITAVVTTIIFWSFELGFYLLFKSNNMKILGGIIGLVIGYIIKYRLDAKFTFIKN